MRCCFSFVELMLKTKRNNLAKRSLKFMPVSSLSRFKKIPKKFCVNLFLKIYEKLPKTQNEKQNLKNKKHSQKKYMHQNRNNDRHK